MKTLGPCLSIPNYINLILSLLHTHTHYSCNKKSIELGIPLTDRYRSSWKKMQTKLDANLKE